MVRCWDGWVPAVAHVLNDGSVGLWCETLKKGGWGQWRLLMLCRWLLLGIGLLVLLKWLQEVRLLALLQLLRGKLRPGRWWER